MPLEQRALCDRCSTDCGGTTEGKHFYNLSDAHGHKKLLCIPCSDEWTQLFTVWMDNVEMKDDVDHNDADSWPICSECNEVQTIESVKGKPVCYECQLEPCVNCGSLTRNSFDSGPVCDSCLALGVPSDISP